MLVKEQKVIVTHNKEHYLIAMYELNLFVDGVCLSAGEVNAIDSQHIISTVTLNGISCGRSHILVQR